MVSTISGRYFSYSSKYDQYDLKTDDVEELVNEFVG